MTTNLRRSAIRTGMTLLVLFLLTLGLTACSGDDAGDDSASSSGDDTAFTSDTAADESGRLADADVGAATDSADSLEAGGESAAAPGSGGGNGQADSIDPAVVASDRQIISTAEVHLHVDDLAAGSRRVDRLVARAGGFVFGEETDLRDNARTRIVIKVPPTAFRGLLDDLATLGDVETQTISTDDVTDQVVDLDSRISTAEVSVFRLRALLDEATAIPDIANIENQLLQRETDLERLRGQRRTIDNQVSMATITAVLRADRTTPPPPPEPPAEPQTGFTDGLRGGAHALRTFAVGASAVAGALLPWSPLLLLAAFVGWRMTRRRTTVG